jgi:hypothetical protein
MLLENSDHLREWFLDWADSQLRRDRFYIYSEAEHAVLARELEKMKPFAGFASYSISELINAAIVYRADCDLPDQEFLDSLNHRGPRDSWFPRRRRIMSGFRA